MPPESTQPATSPDQPSSDYFISPAFEEEMAGWDQAKLEQFWHDTINALVTWGAPVLPFRSPSGDPASDARNNAVIDAYRTELERDPDAQTDDAYRLNRSSMTTDSSGPKVEKVADPVNLFDGDFVYSATDFTIDGAGIGVSFTRSYSQLCSYRGPLGANWDHCYNLWLRIPGDGTIIQRSNGALHEETFRRHEQHGYWIPPEGGSGVLLAHGTSFVHRQPDGVRVFYQPHPTLHPAIHVVARIEDRFGNYLDFAYEDGNLASIVVNHPARVLDLEYDSESRLSVIRDFTGRNWRYDYDDLGDLVAVTTPATGAQRRRSTTCYGYSTESHGDPALQHLLVSILDADGRLYLENEYGVAAGLVSFRRVIRQRQGGGDIHFDYEDVVETFDTPYEPRERPTHQTVITDRDGRQVRHLFNRFGQMLFREEYARLDGVPRLVSSHYRYNRDGNLIAMMSPLGGITQFLYERDLYEREFPPDEDYRSEMDPNLTPEVRIAFDKLRAIVKRGRYYDVQTLDLAMGLWSRDAFPDVLQTDLDDVIQKFTYESEFGQVLTVSDPRVTRSSDPRAVEDAEYDRYLTRFAFTPGGGFQNLLLHSIAFPTPTLPDGTPSQPVRITFPEYDDRGRPVRIVGPNGLEVRNAFTDSAGGVRAGFLETTTVDPSGSAITTGTARDELGRPIKTFRPPFYDHGDERYFTSFEYDELSRVVRSTTTAPFSVSTRNTYSRAGALVRSEIELKDEWNAPSGSVVTTNRFDDEHHLIAQVLGDSARANAKLSRVVFDRAGRPCFEITPSGRKSKRLYGERSLLAKLIDDYGGIDATTRVFYDADARLVRVLDPRGNAVRLGYDALGRLVDTTDPLGNRVIRHFDKLGNLLVECRYEKASADAFRLLARREFSYDELGRLVVAGVNRFETPPSIPSTDLHSAFLTAGPGDLLTIQSFFDAAGNIVKQVDQANRAFVAEYDLLGRAVRKVDPDGNEVRIVYDKEGNVVRVDRIELQRDPATSTVVGRYHFAESFAYDEANRLVERRTTHGRLRYRFDSRGNLVEVEDPVGNRTRNVYDVFGRVIESVQSFHRHEIGEVPQRVATALVYDADDHTISQTDAEGRITRFRYDTAGRAIATLLPDGTADAVTYDRSGNVIEYRDRNGLRQKFEWDALNRPTALRIDSSTLVPEASFVGATTQLAEYDGLGRVTRVRNDSIDRRYVYNSVDQPITEVTTFAAATGLDPTREYRVERRFTASGALADLVYPSGRALHYERDALDRVVAVRQVARGVSYPGDLAPPAQHTLASFGYVGSLVRSVERVNDVSSLYSYDFAGRAIELRHGRGVNPILTSQLLHDAADNPCWRTDASNDFNLMESFRYDSLSRLFETRRATSAVVVDSATIAPASSPLPDPLPNLQGGIEALTVPVPPLESVSYTYDLVGNRLAVVRDGTTETYEPNALDQYARVDATEFRYDRNGNMVEDGAFRYSYDHRNQLTRIVRKSDGHTFEMLRDYFGRGCVQRDDTLATVNVFDGRNLLEQFEGGNPRRSIAYDGAHDGVLAVAAGGHDLFLLPDLYGSVRYVFDGPVRSDFFVYDEFGNLRETLASGADNPFRFAGKMLLGDTGKYDLGFRVYDPTLGRFSQRDPEGFVDGTNLYTYVRNSPIAFSDPDGLESRTEQAINAGLYAGRAAATPIDRAGQPLKGNYNLWSGRGRGMGEELAKNAPGWVMEQTPQHAVAEELRDAWQAKNPNVTMPQDVFDNIWVRRSIQVARRAVLSGMAVASWGLDTHSDPARTVQLKYELPTVRRWGTISGLGMKAGGLLNIWAATHVSNPYVAAIGIAGGGAEVVGGSLYLGGSLLQSTALMSYGSTFARFGGGVGLTVVSGYQFVGDVQNRDVAGAIGSGANAVTGLTMLATTNPFALVATGTFAMSYNGSRWIRSKTGWGDGSAKVGGWVANRLMGSDPGLVRKGASSVVGVTITLAGTIVVEPVAFVGKKIGQGASWSYDKITDLIGYEFDF